MSLCDIFLVALEPVGKRMFDCVLAYRSRAGISEPHIAATESPGVSRAASHALPSASQAMSAVTADRDAFSMRSHHTERRGRQDAGGDVVAQRAQHASRDEDISDRSSFAFLANTSSARCLHFAAAYRHALPEISRIPASTQSTFVPLGAQLGRNHTCVAPLLGERLPAYTRTASAHDATSLHQSTYLTPSSFEWASPFDGLHHELAPDDQQPSPRLHSEYIDSTSYGASLAL